jgi:hypothetical protein
MIHVPRASLVCRFAKNRGRYLQMTRRWIYNLIFCLIKNRTECTNRHGWPHEVLQGWRAVTAWWSILVLSRPQHNELRELELQELLFLPQGLRELCFFSSGLFLICSQYYSQFPNTYVVTHALRLLNYCEDLELGGEFFSYFLEFKPKNPLRA